MAWIGLRPSPQPTTSPSSSPSGGWVGGNAARAGNPSRQLRTNRAAGAMTRRGSTSWPTGSPRTTSPRSRTGTTAALPCSPATTRPQRPPSLQTSQSGVTTHDLTGAAEQVRTMVESDRTRCTPDHPEQLRLSLKRALVRLPCGRLRGVVANQTFGERGTRLRERGPGIDVGLRGSRRARWQHHRYIDLMYQSWSSTLC